MTRPRADESISPMWIAHHYPEDYDRCVLIGRTHVCRRCAVLYPVAFLTLGLALAGVRWTTSLDAWLLVLLPLPAVVEFVAEHLGWIAPHPRLQIVLTVPLGRRPRCRLRPVRAPSGRPALVGDRGRLRRGLPGARC